jgi:hypothetical protein
MLTISDKFDLFLHAIKAYVALAAFLQKIS